MNIKKIAAVGISAAAVAAFAVSSFAFDFGNFNLGKGWSKSKIIPAEEFEGATENSVFTLKYEADETAPYWCVKPHMNDGAGWWFIDNFVGVELSELKDTYVCPPEGNELKFTIPADTLAQIQEVGIGMMGHGVTLISLTFSNDETLPTATTTAAPAAEQPKDGGATAGDTQAATGNPKTGTGLAVSAMVASLGAAIVSRKRK